MALLKSAVRGVIHRLHSPEGKLPQVEFEGGEGPEQIMDQIQTFAVPLIRKAVHPAAAQLLWEELDLDDGRVRRHVWDIRNRLEFELCADDQGLELLLHDDDPDPGADPRAAPPSPRVWVPLRALGEPGRRQCSTLGWTVSDPRFVWRYVEIGSTPRIEMTWQCDAIYRGWAEQIVRRVPGIKCRLGNGANCYLNPTPEGPLFYRGHAALPPDWWRLARWHLALRQPLVVAEAGDEPPHEIDGEVPATVEALDFRAALGDRKTRLVADDDLDQVFRAEVLTPEEVLLPDQIPAGLVPGLPWTLQVEAGESESAAAAAPGNGDGQPVLRRRRWLLTPQQNGGNGNNGHSHDGTWRQIDWQRYPRLAFALGAADPERAPELIKIESRRASVGWRLEASDEDDDELLCFTVPHWVPMGEQDAAVPYHDHSFDYASQVRATFDGLEERFAIDPSSEISAGRIFLDPRRWSFYDEHRGDLTDAEALGEVSGYVRWRRPSDESGLASSKSEVDPSQWARGAAPVLLVRRAARRRAGGENVVGWGGLYVPEEIPWEALQEVRPELAGDDVVITPRASQPALWISLWGFLCRYDRHPVVLAQREAQEVTAWIARHGLELFPGTPDDKSGSKPEAGAGRGFLLRSFAPLYAVRDGDPRAFSLEPGRPRPVLRLGHDLHKSDGPRSIEIGESTFVRFQSTVGHQLPESFGPGRIPGTPLHLSAEPGRTLWFAVEQTVGEAGEAGVGNARVGDAGAAGYLISWDEASRWRFRGFFAHRDATVELGGIRLGGEDRRVLLGDESRAGRRAFRLTLEADGPVWDEATPADVEAAVTGEEVDAWERRYFARDRLPQILRGYEMRIVRQPVDDGPRIFEFLERDDVFDLDPPPGIRVWEPQEGVGEEALRGVRMLAVDEPEPIGSSRPPLDEPAPVPRGPKKKLLKADDDDDDF